MMKKLLQLFIMLAVIFQAETLGEYQESGGILSIEAENGTAGSCWLIGTDAEASNNAYIEIDPAYNHTNSSSPECETPECTVSYDFNISTGGNYQFWFRMHSDNGSDDSFFWRIDDDSWNLENNRYGIGSWFSTNHSQVDSLSAGLHVLEIGYRENGTRLDKFVIQLDSMPDPSGDGPAESSSTPIDQPPLAPGDLNTSLSSGQIDLVWSASSSATSYNVKRSTTSGGAYSTIASNVTTTIYSDTAVTAGTTYYYVVSAENTYGESPNSSETAVIYTDISGLLIDFSSSTSPVQSGYQVYLAAHEQAATFTVQSYSVFGSTVSVTPTWATGAVPTVMQMIDRGTQSYEDSTEDLMRDWIGSDTRSTGDPLTLTISGLPEGDYSWLSYHHDTDASVMGKFDVTVSDASGSVTTTNIQITGKADTTAFDNVARFETIITSNGIDDVLLVFDKLPYSNPLNEAWFIMNGFELYSTYISPCSNAKPVLESEQMLTLQAERTNVINVTVSDDGKPYIEGCDPENPGSGTSYPLEYQWSQINGPEIAIFDPPSADLLNTAIIFPEEGLYEISLEVSDGPITEPERQTAQQVITVDVTASPCFNAPPVVEHAETILALAGRQTLINVTVSDDGRPFIEGCDPDNPQPGNSYPLEYKWLQISGSGTVIFDPPSADLLDTTIKFPLQGIYEISLEVSDGPISEPDRKTVQQIIQVNVIDATDGDINYDGFVNILDLEYIAEQWLTSCTDTIYCADIDNSGLVTLEDYTQLAMNWMDGDPSIIINEFVASNKSSYPDGDGNYPDWIELYNQSTETISLAGWYLTDDLTNLQKWEFPSGTYLSSNAYMIVFASDPEIENYVDQGGNLHTNFALDKDGEYLALVSPLGNIVHEYAPEYPEQKSNISYGLWYGMERYFIVPTPLEENDNEFLGFTDKPNYDHDRGFYDQPFDLEIISDIPDTFIRYTLDGSEPTEQHGTIYDPNIPLHIDTTSVVRAAAFKPGYLAGDVKTATFIFIEDVTQQPTDPEGWPDTWGSEPAQYSGPAIPDIFADYEMDPRVVNNTLPGYSVQEALMDIPTVSIAMDPIEFIGPDDGDGLWSNPLIDTEYKCSIEYIPIDGSDDFQEDCKVENHGFSSRYPQRMQKHNLRLTFTSEYGASKLKYPLFVDSSVETFNQLILRAFSSDSWALVTWMDSRYRPNDSQYTRDVWMKRSLRDMGQPSSYGSYVHVYVNGLYFGLFDMTESVDEAFCEEHFGGEGEDWTVGKDFSGVPAYWDALLDTDVSTLAGYEQSMNYIDIENFSDYMLLHFYADVDDWPHHNGVVVNNTVSGDGKMRFLVWDQAISLDAHGKGATKIDNANGVGALFQKMRTSEEFRLLFADRVYKHCFNDGALSVSGSQNRYLEIANMIDKAIVAESARWGDTQMSTTYGDTIDQPSPLDDINHIYYPPAPNGPDYYFTREQSWIVERDNVINNYIPAIHDQNNSYAIVKVFREKNLYPDFDPPSLMVDGVYQYGGHVETNDILTMVNPNGSGTIYYTLDGSDPRLPGGAVNASSATAYSGAITMTRSIIVKARVLSDSTWSALAETIFAVGPVSDNLRITEIMYHSSDPNTEFIELQNTSVTDTINLNLVKFTKGIDFVFEDMTLAANEYAVIVQDISAFQAKYGTGLNVVGQYEGRLDNDGDRIKIKDALGVEVLDFNYKDSWYELTDGYGFSLTMVDPTCADPNLWDSKEGWRSSLYEGGTPGTGPVAALATDSIVINELLAHSHDTNPDWIELYNNTGQNINISGWFLSDDNSDPNMIRKYEIPPDTIIHAKDYLVFQENYAFGNTSATGCHIPFGLSEGGETIFLYSGQNGELTGYYQTQQKFDASERDVTFGRYEKAELSGGYDFVRQTSKTKSIINSGPLVPDIVITEIHYNPAEGTNYEYVELYNRADSAITLETEVTTETSLGIFTREMISWRLEGTGYEFPPGTTIGPHECVIVAKDPTQYTPVGYDVYGPYDGKLDNGGEEIELQIPGDKEYGKDRYWIPIEQIDYDDTDPWPTSADGGGVSLNRKNIAEYGRDYSNWNAGIPTPGSIN